METHMFSLDALGENGQVFSDFLQLRHRYFVDGLSWNVPTNGHAEMDQYDNLTARYVVVTDQDRVVAGARATSTAAQWGGWTYMIGDAATGRLEGIPQDAVPTPVNDPGVWECTRLVVSDDLDGPGRHLALSLVVRGLCQVAAREGGHSLMSLSPILFQRVLSRLGYDPSPVGDVFLGMEDDRRYRVLQMPIPEFALTPLASDGDQREVA